MKLAVMGKSHPGPSFREYTVLLHTIAHPKRVFRSDGLAGGDGLGLGSYYYFKGTPQDCTPTKWARQLRL